MASRERGSLTLGLSITIGVLVVVLSAAVWWAKNQTEAAAKAKAEADSWQQTAADCSDGVEKADKAAKKAAKRAQDALAKARQGSIASQTELARLKASMGQKATCQAAVARVREGLK